MSRRSRKKKKITAIVTAAGALLLALFMLFLLSREPALRRRREPEATPAPTEIAATAEPKNTVIAAGKEVDPNTDSFDLSGRTLTAEELSEIGALRELTTLSLTGCGVEDLSFVSGLQKLRTLYLPDNQIRDLTPLTSLTELRTLYLDRNPLTDLSALERLPRLNTLSLQGVSVAGYVLDDLRAAMPDCHIFTDTVVSEPRPLSMGGMAFTEDVEVLDLSSREITDISKLSTCLQLRELDLSHNPLDGLKTLTGLPKLATLMLADTGLTDESLQTVAALQHLTYLDLRENPAVTGDGLEMLEKALPNCQIIHDTVYYTLELGGVRLHSDVSEANLSALGLTDVQGLEHFQLLRRLILSGNALTDLTPLTELYSLEELQLGGNRVEDLGFLTGHAALRKLGLTRNAVRDLTALGTCTALEELDLSYNAVESLTALYACTALRRVDLTGNAAVTAEQIRALQVALPGCQIITDVDLSMPEPTPEAPDAPEPTPIPTIPLGAPEG